MNTNEITGVMAHELGACKKPRYAHHDGYRNNCRRDIHASRYRYVGRNVWKQQSEQSIGRFGDTSCRPPRTDGGNAGTNDHQPETIILAGPLGAEICAHPLWLASALEKLDRSAQSIGNHAAENNPATVHLFIVNPLNARSVDNLFMTHRKKCPSVSLAYDN